MDARGLGSIAVRIWGILLLLGSISAVPGVLLLSASGLDAEGIAAVRATRQASLVGLTVGAAIAACLILWSADIARALIPKSEALQVGVTPTQLQRLAFAVVGLVTVVSGLQNTAVAAHTLQAKPEWAETGRFEYLWGRQPEAAIQAVVQLVVGCLLIAGWERIVRAGRVVARVWRPDDDTKEAG